MKFEIIFDMTESLCDMSHVKAIIMTSQNSSDLKLSDVGESCKMKYLFSPDTILNE